MATDLLDLSDTDRPLGRLTVAQQALFNYLAVLAVGSWAEHERLVAREIADLLPAARLDVPEAFAPLLTHAEAAVGYWRGREIRGADWWQIERPMQSAVTTYLLLRAQHARTQHHQTREGGRNVA